MNLVPLAKQLLFNEKKYFSSLEKKLPQLKEKDIPQPKEFLDSIGEKPSIEDVVAATYAACKQHMGKQWTIFDKTYTWDMIPRDQQLKAGIALVDNFSYKEDTVSNNFVRFPTGEGKTLVSLFPIIYHARSQKVHVMTDNAYLAQRDSEWIGPILDSFGISYAFLDPQSQEKEHIYEQDVVFGAANDFFFDELKDSLRPLGTPKLIKEKEIVIVDEADSNLLDRLETPLMIGGYVEAQESIVELTNALAQTLVERQKSATAPLLEKLEQDSYSSLKEKLEHLVLLQRSGVQEEFISEFFSQHPKLEYAAFSYEFTDMSDDDFYKKVSPHLYYTLDGRNISLTQKGQSEVERLVHKVPKVFSLLDFEKEKETILQSTKSSISKKSELTYLEERTRWQTNFLSSMKNSLVAHAVLEKDVDYIVLEDNTIELIDRFTGRSDSLKKFQNGLTQAIEAKEDIPYSFDSVQLTSSNVKSLIQGYDRVIGMSATIKPNHKELQELYGFKVLFAKEHKPRIAIDIPVEVHQSKAQKRSTLLSSVKRQHELGRPILLGTLSIKDSEEIAELFDKEGLSYSLLNAKNEHEEAEIIANAGKLHSIVISTNMAGRGVDIKVPSSVHEQVTKNYVDDVLSRSGQFSKLEIVTYSDLEKEYIQKYIDASDLSWSSNKRGISVSGTGKEKMYSDFHLGLSVFGESLFASERINKQLKGRTGRQGNPGSSEFFVSLEDKIYDDNQLAKNLGERSKNSMFSSLYSYLSVKLAQESSEDNMEGVRRYSGFYANILELQRQEVTSFRESILDNTFDAKDLMKQVIDQTVQKSITYASEPEIQELNFILSQTFNTDFTSSLERLQAIADHQSLHQHIKELAYEKVESLYAARSSYVDAKKESELLLEHLDHQWIHHQEHLQHLKKGSNLASYAGKDPKVVYAKASYDSFVDLQYTVKKDFLEELFHQPLAQEIRLRQSGKVSDVLGELLD